MYVSRELKRRGEKIEREWITYEKKDEREVLSRNQWSFFQHFNNLNLEREETRARISLSFLNGVDFSSSGSESLSNGLLCILSFELIGFISLQYRIVASSPTMSWREWMRIWVPETIPVFSRMSPQQKHNVLVNCCLLFCAQREFVEYFPFSLPSMIQLISCIQHRFKEPIQH